MADTTADLANKALGRLVFSIINRDPVGEQMSALSDALTALKGRVAEDFGELRRLLDEALANDAADDATIAEVTARADELQADIDAAIADAGTVDPDASFPGQPAPAEPVQPEPTN
jgi:hypothetical protein